MPTLEVSEETYELIKDQLKEEEQTPFESYYDFIGRKIFVRTVTFHLLGEVTKIVGKIVFLKNASWIADSGRFNEFIKNGEASEAEFIGDYFFNLDSVVDGRLWTKKLILETK